MRASKKAAGRRESEPTVGHEHECSAASTAVRPDELASFAGLWQALAAALEHPDARGREKVKRSPLPFVAEYAAALGLPETVGRRVAQRWGAQLTPSEDLEWRREHTALFLFAFPNARAPLYESFYLGEHHLLCETPTADVVEAYRRLGLQVADGVGLPADHLVFELEFMAHVAREAVRAAVAGDKEGAHEKLAFLDAFVTEHPARWVSLLRAAVTENARSPYYPDVIGLLHDSLERWVSPDADPLNVPERPRGPGPQISHRPG
ncbi:MAG: molecular chaperone TorD family protein [Thermoleophilia bacterium]|nr:molecular chaperone TorD family protein [Thermoleophilia bacterium]